MSDGLASFSWPPATETACSLCGSAGASASAAPPAPNANDLFGRLKFRPGPIPQEVLDRAWETHRAALEPVSPFDPNLTVSEREQRLRALARRFGDTALFRGPASDVPAHLRKHKGGP